MGRDGLAYIDMAPEPGDVPMYSRASIEQNADMFGGITVYAEWTNDGRQGLTLRFDSIRYAASFHEMYRPDMYLIELDAPVAKFHVPVVVRVTLLDPKRDDYPAHHRARCAGCVVCIVP